MKKFFILIHLFFIFHQSFTQNSVDSNPSGTTAIHKVIGVGSSLTDNNKISSYASTGTASSPNNLIASYGIASNSTATNVGVFGQATGTTSLNNYGVQGVAGVNNGSGAGVYGQNTLYGIGADLGYGGYFSLAVNTGVNASAVARGVYSYVFGLGLVAERTGFDTNITGSASIIASGFKSTVINSGDGATYGGRFVAMGTGTGSKFGIYAAANGNGNTLAAVLDGKVGIGTNTVSTNEIMEVNGRMRLKRAAFTSGLWFNNLVNGTSLTDGAFVGLNNETAGSETVGFWLNGAFRFWVDRAGNTTIGNNATVVANTTTNSLNVSTTATIHTLNVTNSSTFSGSTTFNNTISANDGSFSSSLNVGGQVTSNTLNVGGGGTIFKIKKASVTSTLTSFAGNAFTSQTFTVAGVAIGDVILATPQVSVGNDIIISEVYVSAIDTITIKFYKPTAGSTFPQNNFVFNFVVYKI